MRPARHCRAPPSCRESTPILPRAAILSAARAAVATSALAATSAVAAPLAPARTGCSIARWQELEHRPTIRRWRRALPASRSEIEESLGAVGHLLVNLVLNVARNDV